MRRLALVVLLSACGPEPELTAGAGPGQVSRVALTETPALWGTSVLPLSKGRTATADPDSDTVFVSQDGRIIFQRRFAKGSRPWRLVATPEGVGVVLRGSGELARMQLDSQDAFEVTPACAEARGLAYDAEHDALIVACASGELVTVSRQERTVVDTGLELRDVLIVDGALWVTTFRSAQLLKLSAKGKVLVTLQPPVSTFAGVTFAPHVAWRAISDQPGRVVMVHQLHVIDEVTKLTNPAPSQPYYGAPQCQASVVTAALTVFDTANATVKWSAPAIGAQPVDVAADGHHLAIAFAGAQRVLEVDDAPPAAGCLGASSAGLFVPSNDTPVVAVAYREHQLIVVEHAGHVYEGSNRGFTFAKRELDPGRKLFHDQSPSGVSCASCHPDGFDDGHTWTFGPRHVRSQSLEGGLSRTAPFHWDGHLPGLRDVLNETFVVRMGGERPDSSTASALGAWLDTVPARTGGRLDPRDVKPGRVVFERNGCAACHTGADFTNGDTVDVGTGGRFQVPSLKALRFRGPWMHDGCAEKLEQRFTPACGGSRHGTVDPADVPELVEYLKTL